MYCVSILVAGLEDKVLLLVQVFEADPSRNVAVVSASPFLSKLRFDGPADSSVAGKKEMWLDGGHRLIVGRLVNLAPIEGEEGISKNVLSRFVGSCRLILYWLICFASSFAPSHWGFFKCCYRCGTVSLKLLRRLVGAFVSVL